MRALVVMCLPSLHMYVCVGALLKGSVHLSNDGRSPGEKRQEVTFFSPKLRNRFLLLFRIYTTHAKGRAQK